MTETWTKTHEGKTHDGKVVSVVGDKLTTTCSEGKQHCHTIAKDDKTVATAVEYGKHIPATGHHA